MLTNSATVGGRVQEAREAAGLSRVELAAKCGSSEAAVRMWERNERVPRLKYLALIAQATDRDVSWFFEGLAA